MCCWALHCVLHSVYSFSSSDYLRGWYGNPHSTAEEIGSETPGNLLKLHSEWESEPGFDLVSLPSKLMCALNRWGIPSHLVSSTWNIPLIQSVPAPLLINNKSKCLYKLTTSRNYSEHFTSIDLFAFNLKLFEVGNRLSPPFYRGGNWSPWRGICPVWHSKGQGKCEAPEPIFPPSAPRCLSWWLSAISFQTWHLP